MLGDMLRTALDTVVSTLVTVGGAVAWAALVIVLLLWPRTERRDNPYAGVEKETPVPTPTETESVQADGERRAA